MREDKKWVPNHGPLRTKTKYSQMEMVQADDMRRGFSSGLLGRAQRMVEARDITIARLEQKLTDLEQQLKTAKETKYIQVTKSEYKHLANMVANEEASGSWDDEGVKQIQNAVKAVAAINKRNANNLEGK